MEKDILSAIVEVEKEIQEQLIAEERDAGAMLCRIGQELLDEAEREEKRLAETHQAARAAAKAKAQEQAAAIVQRAATRCEHLLSYDDEALERCIMRHLFRIMPGEGQ